MYKTCVGVTRGMATHMVTPLTRTTIIATHSKNTKSYTYSYHNAAVPGYQKSGLGKANDDVNMANPSAIQTKKWARKQSIKIRFQRLERFRTHY